MDQGLNSTGIFIRSILFLLFISLNSIAIPPSKSKSSQWSVSASGGMAILTREFSKDYIFLENEFRHQPGWAFDLNLGRTFGQHWETSLKAGIFYLRGESDSPDFSAVGNHSSLTGTIYDIPVHYVTAGGSVSGVMRYYFRSFSKRGINGLHLNPYVEAGAGINSFSTELSYQNPPPGSGSTVIFQKGVDNKETTANVLQVIFGAGTKIGNPRKVHFVFSYNADIVNYACLDAVHNYTGNVRNHAKGIISKIMAGIVIPLGSSSRKSGSGDSYLPWSP